VLCEFRSGMSSDLRQQERGGRTGTHGRALGG
jgi:hypothetical protein